MPAWAPPFGRPRTPSPPPRTPARTPPPSPGLQATADELSGQRDSLFKGETLRGLLLSTFAWSTIGRIAGIAAIVAFVAAGVMLVLVFAGLVHRRRTAAA
jgi:hypothetical protein